MRAPDGRPKRPVYIKRRGHLALGKHALFALRPGDHVVKAYHHRGDWHIEVYRVTKIVEEGERVYADLETVAEYDLGEWVPPLPPHLEAPVRAAMEKARHYHCREAHYAE